MPKVTIYHNPKCSKSRQTLALIRERGIEPTIVEYLKEPLDEAALQALLSKLNMKPRDLLRFREPAFVKSGLTPEAGDTVLIRAMVEHPVLIERPVVVCGKKACVGRPPENVLEILS